MDLVPVPVDGPWAVAALRGYFADIIARHHGRPATAETSTPNSPHLPPAI